MKVYRGVVEDNSIKLKEKVGLASGTETLVILKPIFKKRQSGIEKRQIELLDKGFEMGKILYSTREELYER